MADLKASLCGELPNQDSAIPQEQLRALLERRGIVGDPDIPNTKARLAEQELRRNMYHNTQVMLKHYRDIVWALECFPSEVAQELDQPLKDLDALLSVVDTQVALGNAKLEHRLLSIRKSRLLLDRINEALTVLRQKSASAPVSSATKPIRRRLSRRSHRLSPCLLNPTWTNRPDRRLPPQQSSPLKRNRHRQSRRRPSPRRRHPAVSPRNSLQSPPNGPRRSTRAPGRRRIFNCPPP